MKKNLRSSSLTRSTTKNSESPSAKTRKFSELSPEAVSTSTKKTKRAGMNEEMKKCWEEFRVKIEQMVQSTNNKIDTVGMKLELHMQKIEMDVQQLRNDFEQTKEDINRLNTTQNMANEKILDLEVRQNILEQQALENQLIMMNLPPSISNEKLIESINNWTGNITKKESINKVNIISKNNKSSAFIHFSTTTDKQFFMNFVKTKKKIGENYVPILNEQIFELADDDTTRANAVEFSPIMTEKNNRITKAIRDAKKKNSNIERSWLSNGSVFLKLKNQQKAIRIDTIQKLDNINSSIAMEH